MLSALTMATPGCSESALAISNANADLPLPLTPSTSTVDGCGITRSHSEAGSGADSRKEGARATGDFGVLVAGDIVKEIDGKPVKDLNDFFNKMTFDYWPGDTVNVLVSRKDPRDRQYIDFLYTIRLEPLKSNIP